MNNRKVCMVKITGDFITLGQLLKKENYISSGSDAKYFLGSNQVVVNDEIETRRGRKLYPNDVVKINKKEIVIKNED